MLLEKGGHLLVAVVVLSLVVGGCLGAHRQPFPPGTVQSLPLERAPVELAARYDGMKAVPGLLVLTRGRETYLLLMAGRTDPGMEVELVAVQQGNRSDVRILAVLRQGSGTGQYPYLVLRLPSRFGNRFRARLSLGAEEVVELPGIRVSN